MDKKINRIILTGPESTGKTTLAKQLAEEFNTVWVPEYARMYLDDLDRMYGESDLLKIAKGQIELENYLSELANEFIFCDTSMLVLKVWSEHRYGKCHPWILKQFSKRVYDCYVLCNVDIPWTADPQREHPHLREELFQTYEQELIFSKKKYIKIEGNKKERLSNVLAYLKTL